MSGAMGGIHKPAVLGSNNLLLIWTIGYIPPQTTVRSIPVHAHLMENPIPNCTDELMQVPDYVDGAAGGSRDELGDESGSGE